MNRRTALGVALAGPLLGGCQIPGLVMGNLPRGKTPAVYKPPDRRTAVLVDDPAHKLPASRLRGLIAGEAGDVLKRSGAMRSFVPPNRIDEARMNAADFADWPISRVGREVGAKQVIYIQVETFELTLVSDMYRPEAAVRVKIVDAATGRRMFPSGGGGEAGHVVRSELFYDSRQGENRYAAQMDLARGLAERIGENVAKLFHDHKPRPVGSGFKR